MNKRGIESGRERERDCGRGRRKFEKCLASLRERGKEYLCLILRCRIVIPMKTDRERREKGEKQLSR